MPSSTDVIDMANGVQSTTRVVMINARKVTFDIDDDKCLHAAKAADGATSTEDTDDVAPPLDVTSTLAVADSGTFTHVMNAAGAARYAAPGSHVRRRRMDRG
jgi:hypothetical protein